MYLATPSGRIDQAVILDEVYFYGLDTTLLGLVVTPTCDFANEKCELAHVCGIRPAWELVERLLKSSWRGVGLADENGLTREAISNNKRRELGKKITELATQRFPRYHWLQPLPGTETPLVADFQVMQSIPIDELQAQRIRAELASPFREEAAARYAAYLGRVGTDDYQPGQLDGWIEQCIETLFGQGDD